MPCVFFKTFSSKTVPAIRLLRSSSPAATPMPQYGDCICCSSPTTPCSNRNINSINEGKWTPLPIAPVWHGSTSRPGALLLICAGFATSGRKPCDICSLLCRERAPFCPSTPSSLPRMQAVGVFGHLAAICSWHLLWPGSFRRKC